MDSDPKGSRDGGNEAWAQRVEFMQMRKHLFSLYIFKHKFSMIEMDGI